MTLQLGGPIPCWHVSPSLLLLFVFIVVCFYWIARILGGAHLGMDLLASTFERFVLLKKCP